MGLTNSNGRIIAFVGGIFVFGAYALAATRVLSWPPAKLAHVSKKTVVWARIMRLYYMSALLYWPFATACVMLRPS